MVKVEQSTAKPKHPVNFGRDILSVTLVVLTCKLHRLILEHGRGSGRTWTNVFATFHSVAADLVFILAHAFVWHCILTSRRVGRSMVIPFRVVTALLIGVSLVDHAFLLSTGATLDGHIVRYGLAHFAELRPILASVGSRKIALATAFFLGIAVLPAAIRHSRLTSLGARWLVRSRAATFRPKVLVPLSLIGFAFVVQSCIFVSQSPTDSPGFLIQNVHFRLVATSLSELLQERVRERRAAANSAEERLIPTRSDRHYNVVMVILESARAKSFSSYASGLDTTPFFEELSRRGALVEKAYAVAPHTTKALVSIQCGIYPRLDPEPYEATEKGIPARCLPALLGEVGYNSAFFQPAEENFERRKDLVGEFGYAHFAGRQSLARPGFDESNYLGFEDTILLDPVMTWVDRQSAPFLLTVLTLASHHPYFVPAGFTARSFAPDRSENDYLNTLAYTDDFLRRLYHEFETRGLLEQTIFVILGDHGEAFGEHGVRQHDAVPYEEGLQVPMVWVGPPFKAGRRIAGLRQNIDALPTILEAVGFRLSPTSRPGRSMLSTPGHGRLYFSCHYRDYCLATREARNKAIYHYDRRSPEFFDLLFDPDERKSLASDRSLEVKARIDDLQTWKARVNAQFTEGLSWQVTRDVSPSPPSIAHAVEADFGADIRLLGYEIERDELPIGEQLTVVHHFFVAKKPDPASTLVFHLMGPRSEDLTHVPVAGSYPVDQWKPGEYVTDRFTYFARPGTPRGEYRLMVGIWTSKRSSAGSAPVHPLSPGVRIDDDHRVETARWSVVSAPLEREEYVGSVLPPGWDSAESMLSPEVGLVGCRLSKDRVKRGVKTTLSCLYHALRDSPAGRLCVRLDGPTTRSIPHTPVRGTYPMEEWRADQYIRDELDLYMGSADLDGDYRIAVSVQSADSSEAASGACDPSPASLEAATLTLSE